MPYDRGEGQGYGLRVNFIPFLSTKRCEIKRCSLAEQKMKDQALLSFWPNEIPKEGENRGGERKKLFILQQE